MKRWIRGVKRTIAALSAAALLVTGNFSGLFGAAVFSMSEVNAAADSAITYEYYTVTLHNTVPASWLFVGTYLMSARGITPQIYQLALKSKETYKQPIAFYTSELDQGAWKNIKDATDIHHITPGSETYSENDLFPYLITCVVGDDGIPRDPESGESMDVFSNPDPYEMENIPELDKLEAAYQSLLETESTGTSDSYRRQMLGWFFEYDNLDTYDRENLDVAAAYSQYQTLLDDEKKLEDVWDEAMTLAPSNFPSEYRDIMMVMRNFPNIRDKVTDQADENLEQLNTLYETLIAEGREEEADAVLYVSAQVDATRRAEIYYNLTQNENLTGSMLGNRAELTETLVLRREEANAEMMRLAAESDRAQAPIKKLREEINALQDENDELSRQSAEEQTRWEEDGEDAKRETLEEEYARMQEEFAPIEEEYNRLDAKLDEETDAAVELDDEQTALNDQIKALRTAKKEKKKEAEKELSESETELSEKKARFDAAYPRREEYETGLVQIDNWKSNIQRLTVGIEAETTHYETLKAEAENYTSSRFTKLVNSSKVYDPKKKTDLDHQVAASKKIIDTLTEKKDAITASCEALQTEMDALGADLGLEDEISELEAALEARRAELNDELSAFYAEADSTIEEYRGELAEKSEPFQNQLKELEKAYKEFSTYEKTYLAKKSELLEMERKVIEARDAKSAYDTLLSENAAKIQSNTALMDSKENLIPSLQPAADLADGQVDVLKQEVDELDALIANASTATAEDKIYRELYKNARDSIAKRIELVSTAMSDVADAQKKIIRDNALLVDEKNTLKAAPDQIYKDYQANVDAINAEENELETKYQEEVTRADYDLLNLTYHDKEVQEIRYRLLGAVAGKRQKDAEVAQAELDQWLLNHQSEISVLERNVKEAKAALEQEQKIREERLAKEKEAYESRLSDNQKKIEKIEETISANKAILKEYQKDILSTFGGSYEELGSMADTALSFINEDLPLAREFGSAQEEYQKKIDEFQNRTKSLTNEADLLETENEKLSEERTSKTKELDELNGEKEELTVALSQNDDDVSLEEKYNAQVAEINADIDERRAQLDKSLSEYQLYKRGTDAAYEGEQSQLKVIQTSMGTPRRIMAALEPYLEREKKGEPLTSIKKDASKDAELRRQMGGRGFTKWIRNSEQSVSDVYEDNEKLVSSFLTREAQQKKKLKDLEAQKKEINQVIDSIQTSIDELETERSNRLSEAADALGVKRLRKNLEKRLAEVTEAIEEVTAVIEDLDDKMETNTLRITKIRAIENGEYEDTLEMLLVKLNEIDALYHQYDFVDSESITAFGPAPTLLMMQDAFTSGEPEMGRKYENMEAYRRSANYSGDEELAHIIEGAIEDCNTSYERYTKQALTRGETAGDYTGFLMSRRVARNASDKEYCMPYLQMIVDLTNIEGGSAVHELREISLLEGYLIPFAMSDFTTEMTQDAMNDYHYYIRALTERDTVENSIVFVENRLEYAYSMETTFADANQSDLLDTHIRWLENLLRALKEKAGLLSDDDETEDEYAKLIEDRQRAIDEGNIKRAKKIDELLKKKINGGGGLDDTYTPGDDNPSTLEPTDIDPNTRPLAYQEIQELILDEINNPEYDVKPDLTKFINTGGPIEELKKELDKIKNPKNADPILNPSTTGGEGSGGDRTPGAGTDISALDIADAISDVTGHTPDESDDAEAAAIIEALSEIADENPDDDLTDYINDLLNQLLANGCPYVYEQYGADTSTEYVSLIAVDNCRKTSGFRYVRENNTNLTTMTQVFGGSASYTFENGSKTVQKNNGEKDTLSVAATRQTDRYARGEEDTEYTYLSKDDAKKFLYVSGRYIKGTDKAILITSGMEPTVRKLVEALEEKMLLSDE